MKLLKLHILKVYMVSQMLHFIYLKLSFPYSSMQGLAFWIETIDIEVYYLQMIVNHS